MDVSIRLTGEKDIDRVLIGLPKQINHRVLQTAHAAAAKPTVNAAKLLAPEGPTGNLVDSIGIQKTPIGRAGALGEIAVGPRRGRYKGYAAHLVEYGTRARRTRGRGKYRAGASRGTMPKRPFMYPAWIKTQAQVKDSINGQIGRVLYNYMRRTIKRSGL
jgi:hypothetical protein